ncbi:MAG: hypothetical protein WC775_02955 [Patescibacteria group bacterium]|jgi:hypothetical protein
MATTKNGSDWKTYLVKLEDTFDLYLVKKAPTIPKAWKEMIVSFSPWLTVIMLVLLLPVVFAIFGLSMFAMPFAYMGGFRAGTGFIVSWVFSIVTLVLYGLAIPGLFKRQKKAWTFMYYAALITAVENLVSFNIAGFVVGTLISMYVLFQIKEYYK